MVFRLVGLIGLILLPGLGLANEVGVHQALGRWLSQDGIGGASYQPEGGSGELPEDWPHWLLRPKGPDSLNLRFLDRSLSPETTNLDWEHGVGTVLVFGTPEGAEGIRLVVDRGERRPVLLRTSSGVRWRFTDYQTSRSKRASLPKRIVRIGPEGTRTAFVLR